MSRISAALLIALVSSAFLAAAAAADEIIVDLKDTAKWNMPYTGYEVIDYKGKTALRLNEGAGERIAWLKELRFQDGIIELDIAAIPSYTGLAFRVGSDQIYEAVYFRPQNSRLEDPVRRGHTVQYISNPDYTWYHLREKFPEKYEAAADLEPDEWFHVKVVVKGRKAEIYVNEAVQLCLVVDELFRGVSAGSVGLWCGNGSAGTFAGLKITTLPAEEMAEMVGFTPEQEYLFDVFKTRRSVRKFKPDPVPDEHLMKILEIAHSAPTAGNQQPWKFLVIKDPDKIAGLLEACVENSLERYRNSDGFDPDKLDERRERTRQRLGNYLSAPVFVVVLTDKNSRYPDYNIKDGTLAAGYLLIAARALGYGTVFVTDAIPFEVMRKEWRIPDNFEIICVTPIGVPESWPEPPEKKPLGDVAAFERLIEGVNYFVPVTRTAIELPAETLARYIGKYQTDSGLTVTVTVEGTGIFVQADGQQKLEIFPEAEDKFFLKAADVQVTFEKDDNGGITTMIIHQAGNQIQAGKIE